MARKKSETPGDLGDRVTARIDDAARKSLEEIKSRYNWGSDPEAIRGMINLLRNEDRLFADVEGRITNRMVAIFESRLNDIFRSEEFKELILDIIIEELNKESRNSGQV